MTAQSYTSLQKKARAKLLTRSLLYPLLKLSDSPLNKSYWNTYYCASLLSVRNNAVSAKYCGNRWCVVCNRINTAKNINAYGEQISEFVDPYFVTLTVKNPKIYSTGFYPASSYQLSNKKSKRYKIPFIVPRFQAGMLADTYKNMFRVLEQIRDLAKKQKHSIRAIFKFEVTINHVFGEAHPHIHALVEGSDNANFIYNEWLKRNPTISKKGQDCKPADDNSNYELFKYMSKSAYKYYGVFINPYQYQNYIYVELAGKRLFRAWGLKKQAEISETIEGIITTLENINTSDGLYEYQKEVFDWVHVSELPDDEQIEIQFPSHIHGCSELTPKVKRYKKTTKKHNTATGEILTGYQPSEVFTEFVEQIKKPFHNNKPKNRA